MFLPKVCCSLIAVGGINFVPALDFQSRKKEINGSGCGADKYHIQFWVYMGAYIRDIQQVIQQ